MTDDEYAEKIYKYLSGSYTDKGIEKWWDRPRYATLDGRTPTQAWNDGEREKLLNIAYSLAYGAMGT